jgi:hypothetical protein
MNAAEVAMRIARELDAAGLEYAIGGALALGVWGVARATKDVDISIFAPIEPFEPVADALERAGVMLDRVAAPKDAQRTGLFIARFGRIHVDVFMSQHPHADAMRARRRRVTIDGTTLSFVTAEDLCVLKLIYHRDKDVTDLERLFAVRQDLDIEYVRGWLAQIVPPDDARLRTLSKLERLLPART